MTEFAPWTSLAGGALIGLAATILMYGLGRIAGVCGVIVNALALAGQDGARWRIAFLIGLPLGALLVVASGWKDLRLMQFPAGYVMTAVAGLLVGAGATLGSGCTSGHGVCGLARLSKRSLAATATFMATGAATVFVVRHIF
jgi:uncharacterized membrane protein YedE/YeeE